MKKIKTVIVLGKGSLAINIAKWFKESPDYNIICIVPVIPEPTWTDSFKDWANSENLPIIASGDYGEIENVNDPNWKVDLCFSVFYDKIIKEWFIKKCEQILNLHNAPLPRYRGVRPINWALKNNEKIPWHVYMKPFVIAAWTFLSIGIAFGSIWAYYELGWGGWWFWDPVENASFMPWLTGTAFLHSIIIQEKKNMLRVWNTILIMLTFALTIFGTFLTRSGVMSSVHSFTESSLGPIFLAFVAFIVTVCSVLIFHGLPNLKSNKHIESLTSRESGFLFNNVVFVTMCFAVFWGTLFPVFSEAVRGTKITVGPPFFNQINIPIGLILLALTGIGPLLAWRKTSKESLIRNFTIPILSGLVGAALFLFLGYKGYVVISLSLCVFVTATIFTEFARGIKARTNKFNESIFVALWRMVSKNRSRYGGYIVHLGIVLMFVGFTGHAFDKEKEFSLTVGESDHVAGYEFELIKMSETERANHYAWISELRVTDHSGQFITNLRPEKRVYFHKNPDVNRRQPHSELDIYSTMNKDIYSIFSAVDNENGIAFIKIMVNPLVRWVWIGGYILVFGTMIAMWPRKDS